MGSGVNGAATAVPPSGRNEAQRALRAVEHWLTTLEPEDPELLESGADDLRRIGELMMAGATGAELTHAVTVARADGWSWAPIAMLLGISPRQARRHFGSPVTTIAPIR